MECDPNQNETALHKINSDFTQYVLPVTIFVGCEIVIGFLGNLLILYVFIFRYHACNFRTFVIFVSFIDILCTLTTMPAEMVTQNFWYIYPFPTICKTKDFFNVFTVFSESMSLLVIAIDRYRKVCCPLEWQIKPNIALLLCPMMIIVSAAVATPVVVFWGVRCATKTVDSNLTLKVRLCEKDENFKDTVAPFLYEALVGGVVFVFLICMFCMYLRVARTIIQERKESVAHAPVALRIRKKTVIMIILTGCFMFTTGLYYVMICTLGSTANVFEELSNSRKAIFLFFLRFYFIQHIINPILYSAMDPTVREALHDMKLSVVNLISRSRTYFAS